MIWTHEKIQRAKTLAKRNRAIAEIASTHDVPAKDVTLLVFGGVEPTIDSEPQQQNTQGKSGTARKAPGSQPRPGAGTIGDLRQNEARDGAPGARQDGAKPASQTHSHAKASEGNGVVAAGTRIRAGVTSGKKARSRARDMTGDASRPSRGGGPPAATSKPTVSRPGPKAIVFNPAVPTKSTNPLGTQYRLKRRDGNYLHESGLTVTTERYRAWKGTERQMRNVQAKALALTRDMVPEVVE